MYSWGDDTSTWKKPGSYDYGSAKAPYLESLKKEADAKGPRTYLGKSQPALKLVDAKGKNIETLCENPIFVWIDGTGSMQKRPAEIFDRAPLLYQTLSKYKDDVEMCFGVIGDAKSDNYPIQVGNIGKGTNLDEVLKALYAEGGGGPGIRESYELVAYFMKEHVKTPKAVSPFLFVMGDEKFYEQVDTKQVKAVFGDNLVQPVDSMELWKSLAQRFDIYFLKKSYPGHDEEINDQWSEALGVQKIIPVYDDERVVDVAMGIVAKSWGNYSDFKINLSARQDSDKVALVEASIKVAPIAKSVGKMKSLAKCGGKKSKSLLKEE